VAWTDWESMDTGLLCNFQIDLFISNSVSKQIQRLFCFAFLHVSVPQKCANICFREKEGD